MVNEVISTISVQFAVWQIVQTDTMQVSETALVLVFKSKLGKMFINALKWTKQSVRVAYVALVEPNTTD